MTQSQTDCQQHGSTMHSRTLGLLSITSIWRVSGNSFILRLLVEVAL